MAQANKKQSYTVMGITFKVDDEGLAGAADDFRILDDLTNRDPMAQFRAVVSLLKAALGDEYERVLDELQGEEPRLSASKTIEFFQGMASAVAALKN